MTEETPGEQAVRLARLEVSLDAANRSLDEYKNHLDYRLHQMNDLRVQLSNERGLYLARSEYESKHDAVIIAISNLQKFQWMVTGALLISQILGAVVLHLWK